MRPPIGFVILGLLTLPGCPGPGPGPEPTPTPPGPTKYEEMLLRVAAPNQFKTIGGQPVELRGAISCCMDADWAPGARTGWPVNIDPSWQDYAAEAFGANLFHARLGPFLGGELGEPQWAEIGGPYFQHPSGQVDLTRWNEPFWKRVGSWIEYAGERGRYVEMDLIDGWYCKRGIWEDVKMPWMEAYNVQGEDHVQQCSARAIQPDDLFDAFLKKAVSEFGVYGNVIWEDGNEIGITGRYVPEWTLSMMERVRFHEQSSAFGMVHLFGTNSGRDVVRGQVDYVEEHRTSPLEGPMANRPSMVNEYNPRPPFSPTKMNDYRCFAEANGTWWWYWRHEQTLDQMSATAELYRQPCGSTPPTPGCSVPPPTSTDWKPNEEQLATTLWSQYRQALEGVGDRCGQDPEDTLGLIAARMRDLGVCAAGPWADALIAKRSDGLWEEWHAVYYGNGCTIATTGAYKGLWYHPNSGSSCPVPDSCGEKFSLEFHQGVIDSTYTVTSCCAYCASIGMGDYNGQPRCGCPVRPEGDPARAEVERACIGVQRWWCNGQELKPCDGTSPNCIAPNPAQAYCSGHVKTCTADMSGCSEGDF